MPKSPLNVERQRLEDQRQGKADWRLWGPYLAERAWGTVREDYSADGEAWDYFPHDHARSRAYRWSEDGLGGLCDEQQYLCLALALWNGQDPFLKERTFGLTNAEGNRGEDVKEAYFYLDATPSHSWLRYLYRYPQRAFPYQSLIDENARRGRDAPPFGLIEAGAFTENRFWDLEVCYAKASPTQIHARISATNQGPEPAELDVLPTCWFRNTWSWGQPHADLWGDAAEARARAEAQHLDTDPQRPVIRAIEPPSGADWALQSEHPCLGTQFIYGRAADREHAPELLFTENESNAKRLWSGENASPYVKDAFHRFLVGGGASAVNPARTGTKAAACYHLRVEPGSTRTLELVLTAEPLDTPFADSDTLFRTGRADADAFYLHLLPEAEEADAQILRQALAGMIWSKQFYHYDVARWLDGDTIAPPTERRQGRNRHWRHVRARDVLSMPDAWEYPWFAAWDLAYHCVALALVDVDFAKEQVELMLSDRYMHPNGQVPAYEWDFGDVNPPVLAMAAIKVFRAERIQRGSGDHGYLKRVFHKLLLNFSWWINRKDAEGNNLFEGGFLGLDNISVYDRSRALPAGYQLKQADATGWMAHFALKMTLIALELCVEDPQYEDIAIHCYKQFLAIAEAVAGSEETGTPSLWDMDQGFFMDLLETPEGAHRIPVYSWVGLIPLFAVEIVNRRMLNHAPRFERLLKEHKGGLFRGSYVCACPDWENERGERLLSLVDHSMLPRILKRLLDEAQFLSAFGVRSLSRVHAKDQNLGFIPGIGNALIDYVPGESISPMFGGNSNWRGPVWLPTNYSLISSLERFHRFLGDEFTVAVPCLGGKRLNLNEIASLIADRLSNLYRHRNGERVPALSGHWPTDDDRHWHDLLAFHEYFHAETGAGLGASHQTGWTGLLANLVMRHYQRDVRPWSGLDSGETPSLIDEIA
ncbi:MAG: glucosidase [Chromatiaceae bacterium]|nr:glucosidase [Chromatiaceae bacterium]